MYVILINCESNKDTKISFYVKLSTYFSQKPTFLLKREWKKTVYAKKLFFPIFLAKFKWGI